MKIQKLVTHAIKSGETSVNEYVDYILTGDERQLTEEDVNELYASYYEIVDYNVIVKPDDIHIYTDGSFKQEIVSKFKKDVKRFIDDYNSCN